MPVIFLAVFVGAALGALLAPGSLLAAPVDALIRAVGEAAAGAVALFSGDTPHMDLAALLAGTLAPGLLCLVLAEAVRAGTSTRRKAGAALVLASTASFAFLPPTAAFLLVAASVPVALYLSFVAGTLLIAPLAGWGAFLAARVVVVGLHSKLPSPADGELQALLPLGRAWTWVAVGCAVAPVAAAAVRMVSRRTE